MLQVFYFEGVFQEFWLQIVEQILYRTYVIQNSHFWAKLSLSACGTFLSLNLVCIWCPIFNARVQSFKESRAVTMESFSTELIEAITHRCSIKSCSQNIEGTYNRTSVPKYEFMCVVCVCVCVFFYMYVCFYTLPPWRPLPTARCLRHTWGVRINDAMLWVLFQVLLPSSFISVFENVIFHLQRRNSSTPTNWRETIWYIRVTKRWYILI